MNADAPGEGLESVDRCLWCDSQSLEPCVDGVLDWFYGAVDGEFAFAICLECASLVLRQRPDPANITSAYRNYYTRSDSGDKARKDRIAARVGKRVTSGYARHYHSQGSSMIDALLSLPLKAMPGRLMALRAWYRFLPSTPANVLDYGCGNGDFLDRAASLGHRVTGVDFDEKALAFASSRGFQVFDSATVEPDVFANRFDLVTANHVIEHVPDPVALLGLFHAWLRPSGRLYIECPNASATGLGRFGSFWRGLEAPRHFSIPSRIALAEALEKTGFAKIDWIDRQDVRREMDARSRAASQLFAAFEPRMPSAGDFEGPEFLTLVAQRDG